MSYEQYLQSPHWKKTRARKRKRTNKCGICGATQHLDVHHLNYRHLTDVKMSDLRVLCRRCHQLTHDLHRMGVYRFKNDEHNHRWAVMKNAVKLHLKRGTDGLLREADRLDAEYKRLVNEEKSS